MGVTIGGAIMGVGMPLAGCKAHTDIGHGAWRAGSQQYSIHTG
jgi:hypothetical protein